MAKRGSPLKRSSSFSNILCVHLPEQNAYATCPPLKFYGNTGGYELHLRTFRFDSSAMWQNGDLTVVKADATQQSKQEQEQKEVVPVAVEGPAPSLPVLRRNPLVDVQHLQPIFEALPSLCLNFEKDSFCGFGWLPDGLTKIPKQDQKPDEGGAGDVIEKVPSDVDVIFGDAKLRTNRKTAWQVGRLDWLIVMERKHRDAEQKRSLAAVNADSDDEELEDLCCFPYIKVTDIHSWLQLGKHRSQQ